MAQSPDKALEDFRLSRLPSPPTILAKLLEACASQRGDFDELAALIEKDPALSAKVIALANSPLYAGGNLTSLKRALVTLGLGTVKTLAVTASVYQFYSGVEGFDAEGLRRLWRHSYMSGVLARSLAKLTDYPAPDEAYLAGLLHDIGQLLLALALPKEYAKVNRAVSEGMERLPLEHQRVGHGHDAVGAAALESWGLGTFVADAARFHHEPAEALRDAHPLVRLVHIANLLADEGALDAEELSRAAGLFALTTALLEDLQGRARDEVTLNEQAMGLDGSSTASAPSGGDPLTARLRDHALLSAVRDTFDDGDAGEEGVVGSILRSVAILFDLQAALLFDYDGNTNRLRGRAGLGQNARLNELELPLEAGRSVLGEAVLGRTMVRGDGAVSVLDRQLARLLRAEGLIALPLVAGSGVVGVLALGVNRAQGDRLEGRRALLESFARDLAEHWSGWRRRRGEETARRAEVAERYRAHARRVVHEANNPLTIMRNYMALLATKLEEPSEGGLEVRDDLVILREEIDRVAAIVATLPEGPAEEVEEPATLEVNRVIRELVRLLEGSLLMGRRIETRLVLDEAIPPLALSRNSLKQILLNLAKNAVEAMGEEGTLRLESRDYVYLDGEPCVEVTVSDDGPGIPPQVLANLFKPVASDKGGGHQGLGLSIVRNLVNELGGRISCRVGDAGGALFQILLPRRLEED